MEGDKLFHFIGAPMQQWVIFDELVYGVPIQDSQITAIGRMLGTQPGNPNLIPGQCSFQGFHFSDEAAGFTVFQAFIKRVRPFLRYKIFDCRGLWIIWNDAGVVALIRAAPDRIGF